MSRCKPTSTDPDDPLSLHDALPICCGAPENLERIRPSASLCGSRQAGRALHGLRDSVLSPGLPGEQPDPRLQQPKDRKSTRLNSSHRCISYAVFCLKKKIKNVVV